MTLDGGDRAEAQTTEANHLLEREPQLLTLREAIAAAVGGAGGLVVIEGPAGIGKTALLGAARRLAGEAGTRVLRARANELEQEFAFGVARQLFEGLLAGADPSERAALLQGAAGLASPLFDLAHVAAAGGRFVGESGGQPPAAGRLVDRPGGQPPAGRPAADLSFTLVHGLYWLTANLAERGPVMISLDDGHWSDASSLRFLAYLSARLEELPVLLAMTVRGGEPITVDDLLAALRGEPRAIPIELASLSEAAVARLVRSALGEHADAEFCGACAHASAGNPFLLRELIAELSAEHVDQVAASAAHLETVRAASVYRAVVARLARLGGDASTLARAVAVFEAASLRQAAALAGIDDDRARDAADRLVSAQILASGGPLTFLHPLLRRAVYEGIPPAARAASHRRAGLLLATEGARSTRAGAHLLRSEPADDPEIVAVLRDAAREAVAEGATQTAVRMLQRALAEPPPGELRGAVLAELGEAESLARDPAAVEHLTGALQLSEDPSARARLACTLGPLLVWVGQPLKAHAILARTIDELGPESDPALRAAVETVRVATASVDRRLVGTVAPYLPALHGLASPPVRSETRC